MSEQQLSSDARAIVRALETHTAAVTQMAHAVMMLVNAMAEADGEEPEPGYYMDGSPIIADDVDAFTGNPINT